MAALRKTPDSLLTIFVPSVDQQGSNVDVTNQDDSDDEMETKKSKSKKAKRTAVVDGGDSDDDMADATPAKYVGR